MKKIYIFLLFVFAISFSMSGIYYLAGGNPENKLGFTILAAAYMFIPAISAVIVKKIIFKENITTDLMISFRLNRWFLFAWLLMPVIILYSAGISLPRT